MGAASGWSPPAGRRRADLPDQRVHDPRLDQRVHRHDHIALFDRIEAMARFGDDAAAVFTRVAELYLA
jgi:hypothetical protein